MKMKSNDLRRKIEQNQREKEREKEAMERLLPRKKEEDIAFALAQIKSGLDKVDTIFRAENGREYFHVDLFNLELTFETVDKAIERFEAEFPDEYKDISIREFIFNFRVVYRVVFVLKESQ